MSRLLFAIAATVAAGACAHSVSDAPWALVAVLYSLAVVAGGAIMAATWVVCYDLEKMTWFTRRLDIIDTTSNIATILLLLIVAHGDGVHATLTWLLAGRVLVLAWDITAILIGRKEDGDAI